MPRTRVIPALLVMAALVLPGWAQTTDKVNGEEAERVRKAISDYVQRDIKLKGGFFLYDPELKRVVGFGLDHVHEGVTRTPDGQFFACVDMRSVRGQLYDVDVYLQKTEQGLKPIKLIIHKVDGEKRSESQ